MSIDNDPISRQLFAAHAAISSYPEGVEPVREHLRGLGFFPGGRGLWANDKGEFPRLGPGGLMVLGHNLDSVAGYQRPLQHGAERTTGSTWRSLLGLLGRANIPLERCFFTNAYMGLKATGGATGEFPGRRSPDFVSECRTFLSLQVRLVQPAVIATLGKWAPAMLGAISPSLTDWRGVHRLDQLDANGLGFVRAASFAGIGHRVDVVALTHPDRRHLNVGRRRWNGAVGDEAERLMLVEAWRGRR